MFRKRNSLLLLALVILLTVLMLAGCGTDDVDDPDDEDPVDTGPRNVTYVNTHSASGWYLWSAAYSSLVNAHSDLLAVTLGEAGGAQEGFEMLLADMVDISNCNNLEVPKAIAGEAPYDQPYEDLRAVVICAVTPNVLAVRADSGIKSIEDLEGKKINPGGMGTVTEDISFRTMEAIGIEPDWQIMGMSDAIDALRDGRIDGFFKTAASPTAPDSVILELQMTIDMEIISFTEEQAQILVDQGIAIMFDVPAGVYEGQDEPKLSKGTSYGIITKKDNLTREEAYDFAKIGFTLQDMLEGATPGPPIENPIEIFIQTTPYYFHAGTIDLLVELGYEDQIPEDRIPPEYQ